MSHFVTGFITKTEFAHQICVKHSSLRAVHLEQEFSLFPLTDELLKNLHVPCHKGLEESGNLPNELTDLLAKLSAICPLLYFETEYFGGWGNQLAIVFENGKITFGPAQNSIGPINDGLRLLGVPAKANIDEFDILGLGQNRFSDDWLK
jgi:hypothetical protein